MCNTDILECNNFCSFQLLQFPAVHPLDVKGEASREAGDCEPGVRVGRHPRRGASVDVETVRHVLEDVVRHGAPRVLDEHADAHQDAVEEVFLHLERRKKFNYEEQDKPLDAPLPHR